MTLILLLLLFIIAAQASRIAKQDRMLREFDKRARGPRAAPR